MTYRELYDSALRIVSENDQNLVNEDYEDRAGYILAAFCTECAPIDAKYRVANQMLSNQFTPVSVVKLSNQFPLKEIFAPAAVYYLSAMLVSDENETLCDRLFELYTDAISSIQDNLPCLSESIVNCYPNLI